MPKPKRRPSMADVAQLSGVTKMTVSRFFSGRTTVSEDTRDLIIEAAERVGFACAACGTIDVLPLMLTIAGDPFYFCDFACCRKFIANR